MAWINVQIKQGETDITKKTLEYKRNLNICTGVGLATILVDKSLTVNPGDTFSIYEGGILKGVYWTSTVSVNTRGEKTVSCQDNSKWLQDYFIEQLYNYAGHTSRYWVEKIAKMAGLTTTFLANAGNGYTQPSGIEFGLETAYDSILRICQQSGWYFYFNYDGECVVGSLDASISNYTTTITEDTILEEVLHGDDDLLRNRAVVWGGFTDTTPSYPVYISLRRQTPWDRTPGDARTIVFGNSYIRDYGTAQEIGKKILDEFSQTIEQKTYVVAGALNVTLGNGIRCKTGIFNGIGMLTQLTIQASSSGGLQTILTLDERCPRLFGYYSYGAQEYVYIGTREHGVYRKLLTGTTWEAYNTGMINKNIRDLKIKNGLLVATTSGKEVYKRFVGDSSWEQITPQGWTEFVDGSPVDYYTDNFISAGVGIKSGTGEIIVGYNDISTGKAWVMKYTSSTIFSFTQVIASSRDELTVVDTDHNGKNTVLTTLTNVPSWAETYYGLYGYNQTLQSINETGGTYIDEGTMISKYTPNVGTAYEECTLTELQEWGLSSEDSWAVFILDNFVYTGGYSSLIGKYDLVTDTKTNLSMSTPISDGIRHIYTDDHNTFELLFYETGLGWYHSTWVYSTDTTTNHGLIYDVGDAPTDAVREGFVQAGQYFYWWEEGASRTIWKLVQYDMVSRNKETYTFPDLNKGYNSLSSNNARVFVTDDYVFGGVSSTRDSSGYGSVLYSEAATFYHSSFPSPITTNSPTLWDENKDGEMFEETESYTSVHEYGGWQQIADNRLGEVWVALRGWWKSTLAGQEIAHLYANVYRLPTINLIRSKYWEWDGVETFDGAHYYGRTGDAGETTFSNDYGEPFNTLRKLSVRSGFYALTQKKDASGGPNKGYVFNLATEQEILASGIYGNWAREALDYDIYTVELTDELDNTICTGGATNDNELRAYSIENGQLVKTYYGATNDFDDEFRYLFFHPAGLLLYVFEADLSIFNHDHTIRIYSVSGVGMPPDQTGVSVLTDNFITTAGDTFGVLGSFSISGHAFADIAHNSPSVFFAGEVSSGVNTGEMYLSEVLTSGDWHGVTTTYNSKQIPKILDARTVDILGQAYTSVSGVLIGEETDYERYIYAVFENVSGVAGGVYFRQADSYEGDWYQFITMSDTHKFESTNFLGNYPYMFFSTSGAPSKFYQKDADEFSFEEQSTGLPSSNITVIRVDDKI